MYEYVAMLGSIPSCHVMLVHELRQQLHDTCTHQQHLASYVMLAQLMLAWERQVWTPHGWMPRSDADEHVMRMQPDIRMRDGVRRWNRVGKGEQVR